MYVSGDLDECQGYVLTLKQVDSHGKNMKKMLGNSFKVK